MAKPAGFVLMALLAGWLLIQLLVRPTVSQGGSVGLSIVPAITEKVTSAGQLSTVPITVTNVSGDAQAVEVDFRPIAPTDPVIDESARVRYDASGWLSGGDSEFLLGQEESRTVQIRINPPSDAGPGGHYAYVVFRVLNQPGGEQSSSQTLVSPELASTLFLTVPGDINELAEADFKSPSWFNQSNPRQFTASLSALGNVHLLPRASVSIRQLDGREVDKLDMPSKLVIPGTQAVFTADWNDAPPGIYKSQLEVTYGSPAKHISLSSGMFIVLPSVWIQLLAIITVGAAARYTLPPVFRRLQRRKVRLGSDLTGEPNIRIKRERIEAADRMSRLKDASKRK